MGGGVFMGDDGVEMVWGLGCRDGRVLGDGGVLGMVRRLWVVRSLLLVEV